MLLPEPLGPLSRWKSEPPWQDTFQKVFGFSVDTFYDDFASWRSRLSALSIRGRVVGPDGQGLPYIKVIGRSEASEDVPWYWDRSFTYTDPDGHFELPVSAEAAVGVDLGDCEAYYSPQGLVSGPSLAPRMSPDSNGAEGVAIRLTDSTCVWQIHGQVLDADANPLANIQVSAVRENGDSSSTRTKSDGSFAITVGEAGLFRVNVWIDGCPAYFRQGQNPGGRQQATLFSVQDGDVTGIRFQLTEGLCSTRITGRLLDADGAGIAEVRVYAHGENNTNASDRTESDGSFSIIVPNADVYRLNTSIEGCSVYFRRGGAVTSRDQATRITVDDRDVTGVRFQLREGQCSTKITGQLLDADDDPLANVRVWAQPENGTSSGAQTDSDGSFSITVPEAGQYRVSTRIDGCSVYYRRSGITANWNQATQIRVSDSDVTGIRIQLTEGMCEHRISGRLLNADGSTRASMWVSASGNAGSGGASTAADGSFSFAVPGNGSYRLSVYIDGCSIYRGARAPAKNWNGASQTTVSNADVTGIEFRLPEDPATFCN